MTRFLFVAYFLGGLLLSTAACDDPSNVGIGLVEEQGTPELRTLAASLFAPDTLKDFTGAAQRVLAGRVDDPLLGLLTATGYVDFQSPGFDTTGGPTIAGVALELKPNYVYGDTTAPVAMDLFDLVEDWTATGAASDTTLPRGNLVTAFDVRPADTLVTVVLPEAWVAANDTTLRSARFETSFHGFALEARAGNAVVGFDAASSRLRIFTDQDTLGYTLTRTLSGVQRTGTPNLPPSHIAVQDGVGHSVRFNFDLSGADLQEVPLNGATIRIYADTLATQAVPAGFVRPLVRRLQLVGVTENDAAFLLADARLDPKGYFRFSAPPSATALSIRELLQRTVLGQNLYDHFELRFPFEDNSINALLLFDTAVDERAPALLLTISPSGR